MNGAADELVEALGRLLRMESASEAEEDALIARITELSPDPNWMDAVFHAAPDAPWLDEKGMPDPQRTAAHLRDYRPITL